MKLTYANKLRDYVKEQINPYGKPFEGSVYEFGLKIMDYIDNMLADYNANNVVEQIKSAKDEDNMVCYINNKQVIEKERAIEIVKNGGVSDESDV